MLPVATTFLKWVSANWVSVFPLMLPRALKFLDEKIPSFVMPLTPIDWLKDEKIPIKTLREKLTRD